MGSSDGSKAIMVDLLVEEAVFPAPSDDAKAAAVSFKQQDMGRMWMLT